MTNLLELGNKAKIKKIQKTIDDVSNILKAINAAKKALQVYHEYRSLKFILVDLDEVHRMYFALYKKAKDNLKDILGEEDGKEDKN